MMNDSNHTVAVVAENYLCCSCGACQVVCPVNAIILKETPGGYIFPIVNHDLCTDCGACQGSCAGIRLASDLPEDPFTGPVLGCWVGRSTDDEIFRKSQSGGAVTAILESLLADKKIDGAATVVMESGNPPRPLVRIARTREDLLSAQGSKYSPVPLLTFLENPKSNGKPLAAVALACHVHGLHNVFEAFPTFRKMVGPVIGLVCDRVMTCQAIDYILWRSKMKENDPVSLEFRSKEWRGYPGDVRVRDVKGHVTNLSRKQRTEIKDYFTPPRCRLCFDKMNVLADITVGDPWGIPGADKTRGESVVIARTPRGLETVRKAIEKEQILLREVPYELVLEGQSIEQKKREFAGYCSSWASMQRPLPEQAKRVLGIVGTVEREDHYSKNLRHSLSLDQFPSSVAIARDARKWVINRKIIKIINKILKPLDSSARKRSDGVTDSRQSEQPMNIEILGAGFKNKGAHLMLVAVVEELSRSLPEARLAIPLKQGNHWDEGNLGLYQKPIASESLLSDLLLRLRFRQTTRKRLRMTLDSEINVVLDASGFKYSDQFGHRSIAKRAKMIKRWKRRGKKIILLPQAFGPLEAPRVRKAVLSLADNADLIFPRDQESYDYLTELVGERDHIRISPDFTNMVQGKRPDYFTPVKPRACLIPNAQMMERTSDEIRKAYIPFFGRCAQFLKEADLDPFILLHEVEKDGPLAREVQQSSGLALEIIEEKDPVHIKGIIGACYLVVGSRFHALISAVSQGIPAVATSWSHKYERLFEEWGCPELLISDLNFNAEARFVLQKLMEKQTHDELVTRLVNSNHAMLHKTSDMWSQVMEEISI